MGWTSSWQQPSKSDQCWSWLCPKLASRQEESARVREMGGAPRHPAPRNHSLVRIVRPSGWRCTDAFGGKKNYIYVYIYVYIHTYVYTYIYIYIYNYRGVPTSLRSTSLLPFSALRSDVELPPAVWALVAEDKSRLTGVAKKSLCKKVLSLRWPRYCWPPFDYNFTNNGSQ